MSPPRIIVLVAIQGVQLLDVSGPLDVFAEPMSSPVSRPIGCRSWA
jgi:hypothetical protein